MNWHLDANMLGIFVDMGSQFTAMFILAPAKQQLGGKSDTQNSFVLFDGQSIVLSKSIRRISTTWRSHLAHYLHCKRYSWQFKSGFGARILPTMKRAIPQSASFEVPLAPIESSKLHDPDAEAVIEFAEQEKRPRRSSVQ